MSGRQVFQYVLTGLFAVVFASPGLAQFTDPTPFIVPINDDPVLRLPGQNSQNLPSLPFYVPLWPCEQHSVFVPPPRCAFDCQQNQGAAQISPASGSVNSDAGLTGNVVINERNFDLLIWPTRDCWGGNNNGFIFGDSRAEEGMRHWMKQKYPFPIVGLTTLHWSENGGWWLEKVRIPLPREGTPQFQDVIFCDRGTVEQNNSIHNDRVAVGAGIRVTIPALGPLPLALDFAVPCHTEPQVAPSGNNHSCCNTPVSAPCCAKANSLAGTWVHELENAVIAVTVTGDEMKICLSQKIEGTIQSVTLTADYTMSKDGLVHGVITGLEVAEKHDSTATPSLPNAAPNNAIYSAIQTLVDCPFSFRTRITSLGLMVSNLKVATPQEFGVSPKETLAVICGMYKLSKDGTVPAPKEHTSKSNPPLSAPGNLLTEFCDPNAKPSWYLLHRVDYPARTGLPAGSGSDSNTPSYGTIGNPYPYHSSVVPGALAAPTTVLPTLPPPRECSGTAEPSTKQSDHKQLFHFSIGVFGGDGFSSNDSSVVPPAPPEYRAVPPQTLFAPPMPPNVPPQTFDNMVDIFGQMMNGNQPLAAAVVPPAPSVPCPVQPACAMPPMTQVVPPFAAAMPVTRTGPVGTWVRVVGPVVYVIQIAPDHMTVTATSALEDENGKILTEGMILTADYHLMRDGTTMVGLITSLDARVDGDSLTAANLGDIAEELSCLQKAVTDKPFAMSVRVYGDALAIGNVRLPEVESSDCWDPMTVLGGRYTAAGEKPLPKPRAAKAPLPLPMPICLPPGPPQGIMTPCMPGCGPAGIMGPPTTIPMLPPPPPVGRHNPRSAAVPYLGLATVTPDLNEYSSRRASGQITPVTGQTPYLPAPPYQLPASSMPPVMDAATPAPPPEVEKKPSAQKFPERIEPSK